jgi:hypothetical protein
MAMHGVRQLRCYIAIARRATITTLPRSRPICYQI